MHALIEAKKAQIEELCRRLGVRWLDLFESATGESFDEDSSDVDVLGLAPRRPRTVTACAPAAVGSRAYQNRAIAATRRVAWKPSSRSNRRRSG